MQGYRMPNEQHAQIPISQLDITPYAIRCLKKNGVHSVQQLLSMSAVDLLRLPGNGIGKGSLQVITASLAKKGLQLKGEPLK